MSRLDVFVCLLLELIVLFGRKERAKDVEILVLRHELGGRLRVRVEAREDER